MSATIDNLIFSLSALNLRLGQLGQSDRGWEAMVWRGRIGYGEYSCGTGRTAAGALEEAIGKMERNEVGRGEDVGRREAAAPPPAGRGPPPPPPPRPPRAPPNVPLFA